jgi:23S rRNA (cytosine1962-C5)-methyltransferase
MPHVTVTTRGAKRWAAGHPWIYRSDVAEAAEFPAGVVLTRDSAGRTLGWALWSPRSEISLRLLDRDPDAHIDARWWRTRVARAVQRREPLRSHATAYRLVHGEGDGCPSLVCDRYDRWLVVQLMTAGLEACREQIVEALLDLLTPDGILARNDAALRSKEGLARETVLLHGSVPEEVEVVEHGIRYLAAPWRGQKTGAFLDQRESRALVGSVARGRAHDCLNKNRKLAQHHARGADHLNAHEK